MTDRPIIFSAPMVRALLEGRKTQTRRVLMKRAATNALAVFGPSFLQLPGNVDLVGYAIGDRLWVREAFSLDFGGGHSIGGTGEWHYSLEFRAGGSRDLYFSGDCEQDPYERLADTQVGDWRQSIHMPRWASRLTLIVTDVRVQRLWEITEDDAVAEGCGHDSDGWRDYQMPGTQCCATARDSYRTLWNSLHGSEAWEANPWVVAISFRTILANIDSTEAAA